MLPMNTDSGEFKPIDIIEGLIKKEEYQDTESMSGKVLNRIKTEPNNIDWNECGANTKNTLKFEYELKIEREHEVKEELVDKAEFNENINVISTICRIKSEVDDKYDASEIEDLRISLDAVKEETDMDSEEFKVAEITEEYIIKSESETSLDETLDLAPNSMEKSKFKKKHQVVYQKTGRESFSCYSCNYTAYSKHRLTRHLKLHDNKKYLNIPRPGFKLYTCIKCHVKFMTKTALHDHMKQNHSTAVPSVSSQIYKCKKCEYKTTINSDFDSHMQKHGKVADQFELKTCMHCTATFKNKISLDDHVVRNHPDFIGSVNRKIHKCTECSYKTIKKSNFDGHVSIHAETASNSNCIHCNSKFKSDVLLDNHIVRRHPDFITSVANEIYECTNCTYKTTIKHCFNKHMLRHPETASNCETVCCIHCNASFKYKISLDDHVVKKHPDFITSITSKLYECTKCIYKTTKKSHFDAHVAVHPETSSKFKLSMCIYWEETFRDGKALDGHMSEKHPTLGSNTIKNKSCSLHLETASVNRLDRCIHCDATFKTMLSLDDHLLKKHPDVISPISRKIYECSLCNYKTVVKICFNRHISIHHDNDTSTKTSRSFRCLKCPYTAYSERHLISHMKVHDDRECVDFKTLLDDHMTQIHPKDVPSVSSEMYECKKCTYKTTMNSEFDTHMQNHMKIVDQFKLKTCVHCVSTFKSNRALDDHVVRNHPSFITSINRTIYECTECLYKTVKKSSYIGHVSTHRSRNKLDACLHCNTTFKSKRSLDDHVVRKHPNFITSVTRKIYECGKCMYKTVSKSSFDKHNGSVHPETA